jgi:hypothetical protein
MLKKGARVMEVHFSPDVQAKLERLAIDTGRPADELLQDALAGYFDELAETREMLDSRYDDLKSGRVKPISGDEVKERLRVRSAARHAEHQ